MILSHIRTQPGLGQVHFKCDKNLYWCFLDDIDSPEPFSLYRCSKDGEPQNEGVVSAPVFINPWITENPISIERDCHRWLIKHKYYRAVGPAIKEYSTMLTRDELKGIDATIGANVRMRRKIFNMTQEGVAERMGLTFQQIQKYEKGSNRISGSRLAQIAAIFGCHPAELFEGVTQVSNDDERILHRLVADKEGRELLRALDHADPNMLGALTIMVHKLNSAMP